MTWGLLFVIITWALAAACGKAGVLVWGLIVGWLCYLATQTLLDDLAATRDRSNKIFLEQRYKDLLRKTSPGKDRAEIRARYRQAMARIENQDTRENDSGVAPVLAGVAGFNFPLLGILVLGVGLVIYALSDRVRR